jgi:hypothetical protein
MTESIALLLEPMIVCVARMWRYFDDHRHWIVLDTTISNVEVDSKADDKTIIALTCHSGALPLYVRYCPRGTDPGPTSEFPGFPKAKRPSS